MLVIDDHENNRLLLEDILSLAGHKVAWPPPAAGLALLPDAVRSTSSCSTC